MPRPLLKTVAEMQVLLDQAFARIDHQDRVAAVQSAQIHHIAQLAGVSKASAAIRRMADVDNPAQPVPDPPDEAPSETTEEAATPEAYDDVRNPGLTPGSVSHVPAETTDVALNPGESLPTSPYGPGGLQDVTAPVNGTETHVPNDQTRIETDVRVGDPMAKDIAFPWDIGPNNSNGGKAASAAAPAPDAAQARFMAAVRLARLRIAAGLEEGDDLQIAAAIQASDATDRDIDTQTQTLSSVQKAASRGQQRPANLVPRAAAAQGTRVTPSIVGEGLGMQHQASSVADDTADSDLFD